MSEFVLEVLALALDRTARQFVYCAPQIESWMPALAREIRKATKELAKRDGA